MIELVADFLNTLDLRSYGRHATTPPSEREGLETPEALQAWLAERGVQPSAPAGERDLIAARRVRDQLRTQLMQRDLGRADRPLHADATGAPEFPYHLAFRDARPELVPLSSEAAAMAWLFSRAISVPEREWARLKICASPECRWAFVDRSKNGLGRWCTMRVCGNRHKIRRYRRKASPGRPAK